MARPGGPDVTMMAASVGIDGGSDLDMGLLDGLDATLSHDFGLTSREAEKMAWSTRKCIADFCRKPARNTVPANLAYRGKTLQGPVCPAHHQMLRRHFQIDANNPHVKCRNGACAKNCAEVLDAMLEGMAAEARAAAVRAARVPPAAAAAPPGPAFAMGAAPAPARFAQPRATMAAPVAPPQACVVAAPLVGGGAPSSLSLQQQRMLYSQAQAASAGMAVTPERLSFGTTAPATASTATVAAPPGTTTAGGSTFSCMSGIGMETNSFGLMSSAELRATAVASGDLSMIEHMGVVNTDSAFNTVPPAQRPAVAPVAPAPTAAVVRAMEDEEDDDFNADVWG